MKIKLFISITLIFSIICLLFGGNVKKNNFKIYLNGHKIEYPWFYSLTGTPEKMMAGDVIEINYFYLTLGKPGIYKFKIDPKKEQILLLKYGTDDSYYKVAVKIERDYDSSKKKAYHNPLKNMPAKEIKRLRGLLIDGWPDKIEEKLKHIDGEKIFLTVSEDTKQKGDKFPTLPVDLEYLNIDEDSSMGIKDFSPMKKLVNLKFLIFDLLTIDEFNLDYIKDCKSLKYLELSFKLKNGGKLGNHKELRTLDLSYSKISDIAFIKKLPNLSILHIDNTSVTDLSPIAGHPSLKGIDTDRSPIKYLKGKNVPELIELSILSTLISKDDINNFIKKNPQCNVKHSWQEELNKTMKNTTMIRVRTGGTCHTDPKREKTLFKITDKNKIKNFINSIIVDENNSGFHCMCCGLPTFEFYKKNKLLGSIGFHHGQSLRWPGGWPGDAAITDACADFLCKLLADNGVKGPLNEREESKKQEIAANLKLEKVNEIIPSSVQEELEDAKSKDDILKAFNKGIKDKVKLALLFLKLFGCDNGSWNSYSLYDSFCQEKGLPSIQKKIMSKALNKAINDDQGINGAARWLFQEEKWEDIDPKVFNKILGNVAEKALTHPRKYNRIKTIAILGEIKGNKVINILRKVLNSKIKVRPLKKEDTTEPGGMISYKGGISSVECSDQTFAALILAELNDKESKKKIKKLLSKANKEDKKILNKAIKKIK